MSGNRPRISPLERTPTRPAKAKHALKSKLSAYCIPGYDTIPGYIKSSFPGLDRQTYIVMENILRKYVDKHNTVPTVTHIIHTKMFDGLV